MADHDKNENGFAAPTAIPPPLSPIYHPWAVCIEKYCGLREIECDADGLYNGLIMPPEQHWVLWFCSGAALGTATYALLRGMHDFALITFCVAFTSLNYWRNPVYCWRRNMDVMFVVGGLFYHIGHAIYSEYAALYFTIVFIGLCAYGLSVYTHKKSSWLSTLFHIIVHICANASNCVLYSSNNIARTAFL